MASAIMADAAELTPKENTIVDIGAESGAAAAFAIGGIKGFDA